MRTLEGDEADLPPFFTRNGLSIKDYERCLDLARAYLPGQTPEPLQEQGGCSFTLVARDARRDSPVQGEAALCPDDGGTIVQFRLARYAIPLRLARDARGVYGGLVPRAEEVGRVRVGGGGGEGGEVQCCAMSFVGGTRVGELLPRSRSLSAGEREGLRGLMVSFAGFFALSYRSDVARGMGDERCNEGRVGSSIPARLRWLEDELPSASLRDAARRARGALDAGALRNVPVSLTHGDLLPSNVLVQPQTWEITGVVDWAEAEYLPFGMGLYGVEHLLGRLVVNQDRGGARFEYYHGADNLRTLFWRTLVQYVPELVAPEVCKAVQLARVIGVLLWHGIAWDDGKIDRVINAEDDGEELAYLTAFLQSAF